MEKLKGFNMTGILIKHIKGMIGNRKCPVHFSQDCSCIRVYDVITQQGEVKIGLNREKLSQIIGDSPYFDGGSTDKIADAIIANQKDLIERQD